MNRPPSTAKQLFGTVTPMTKTESDDAARPQQHAIQASSATREALKASIARLNAENGWGRRDRNTETR